MIQVEQLTKRYGSHTAIEDVSFEVRRGEILGFLGPNGAGKTTTMRILSGFFPSTSGTARVAGFDVFDQPLEVKRRVGYLPESPPLYGEMSVDSYLRFAASIKDVEPDKIELRLSEAKRHCGLTDQGPRLIKHLSKGFRQRVGLAQALIHKPEVLILDEPTVGLDPQQIIEVRNLIKGLAGEHTIILSTHILPEVGMTCQRVVIINKGRIAAVDSPENLTARLSKGSRIDMEVSGPAQELLEALQRLPAVRSAQLGPVSGERSTLAIESDGEEDIRPLAARCAIESGCDLYRLQSQTMSLEDIFLKLITEEETDSDGGGAGDSSASDESAEAIVEEGPQEEDRQLREAAP